MTFLLPPRRCYTCGTAFPDRHQASCNLCPMGLTVLDSFRFWRRWRRAQHRSAQQGAAASADNAALSSPVQSIERRPSVLLNRRVDDSRVAREAPDRAGSWSETA